MRNRKLISLIFGMILLLLTSGLVYGGIRDSINLVPTAKTAALPDSATIVSPPADPNVDIGNLGQPQGMEGAWLICNGQIRYQYIDGSYLFNTWATIDNQRYRFDENGYRLMGWINLDGLWYYLNDQGVLQTGWINLNNNWYYLDGNGVQVTGWFEDNGQKYYMNEEGIRQTGWIDVNGVQYYFSPDGVMSLGWVNDGTATYYLDADSKKATGWLTLGDKQYYLDSNGVLQHGWLILDGKACYFNENGELATPIGEANSKMVALTFDDGPGSQTDRLLKILQNNGAKATFFLIGEQMNTYANTVKQMEAIGCQVGSHTFDHKNLTSLDVAQATAEIAQTNAAFTAILGHGPSLTRPPGGNYNEEILKLLGTPAILWNVDTKDWQTKNAANTVITTLNTVKDGDIILMHDIYSTSVDAAEILIPAMKQLGYQFVTVSELAAAKGQTLEAGKTYSSFH